MAFSSEVQERAAMRCAPERLRRSTFFSFADSRMRNWEAYDIPFVRREFGTLLRLLGMPSDTQYSFLNFFGRVDKDQRG